MQFLITMKAELNWNSSNMYCGWMDSLHSSNHDKENETWIVNMGEDLNNVWIGKVKLLPLEFSRVMYLENDLNPISVNSGPIYDVYGRSNMMLVFGDNVPVSYFSRTDFHHGFTLYGLEKNDSSYNLHTTYGDSYSFNDFFLKLAEYYSHFAVPIKPLYKPLRSSSYGKFDIIYKYVENTPYKWHLFWNIAKSQNRPDLESIAYENELALITALRTQTNDINNKLKKYTDTWATTELYDSNGNQIVTDSMHFDPDLSVKFIRKNDVTEDLFFFGSGRKMIKFHPEYIIVLEELSFRINSTTIYYIRTILPAGVAYNNDEIRIPINHSTMYEQFFPLFNDLQSYYSISNINDPSTFSWTPRNTSETNETMLAFVYGDKKGFDTLKISVDRSEIESVFFNNDFYQLKGIEKSNINTSIRFSNGFLDIKRIELYIIIVEINQSLLQTSPIINHSEIYHTIRSVQKTYPSMQLGSDERIAFLENGTQNFTELMNICSIRIKNHTSGSGNMITFDKINYELLVTESMDEILLAKYFVDLVEVEFQQPDLTNSTRWMISNITKKAANAIDFKNPMTLINGSSQVSLMETHFLITENNRTNYLYFEPKNRNNILFDSNMTLAYEVEYFLILKRSSAQYLGSSTFLLTNMTVSLQNVNHSEDFVIEVSSNSNTIQPQLSKYLITERKTSQKTFLNNKFLKKNSLITINTSSMTINEIAYFVNLSRYDPSVHLIHDSDLYLINNVSRSLDDAEQNYNISETIFKGSAKETTIKNSLSIRSVGGTVGGSISGYESMLMMMKDDRSKHVFFTSDFQTSIEIAHFVCLRKEIYATQFFGEDLFVLSNISRNIENIEQCNYSSVLIENSDLNREFEEDVIIHQRLNNESDSKLNRFTLRNEGITLFNNISQPVKKLAFYLKFNKTTQSSPVANRRTSLKLGDTSQTQSNSTIDQIYVVVPDESSDGTFTPVELNSTLFSILENFLKLNSLSDVQSVTAININSGCDLLVDDVLTNTTTTHSFTIDCDSQLKKSRTWIAPLIFSIIIVTIVILVIVIAIIVEKIG